MTFPIVKFVFYENDRNKSLFFALCPSFFLIKIEKWKKRMEDENDLLLEPGMFF
jgi:hypothetical protein